MGKQTTNDAAGRKLKKLMCEQLYVVQDMSVSECAALVGVTEQTVYRWVAECKWNAKKMEAHALESQIALNAQKALVVGLKAYTEDPNNKNLMSLVSLLKQIHTQQKPTAMYKENILEFLDKTVGYFLSKGLTDIADVFKQNVVELAEYMLPRR